MVHTSLDLRNLVKKQMLENVQAQRVIDQACRTAKAAAIGKCIDVTYLREHFAKLGIQARIAPAVVDDWIRNLDPDGDGVLDYHAFLKSVCGAQTADFLLIMQNLQLNDTIRETKMRKIARRKRMQEAAAAEISDPFELLRAKITAGQGSMNFRQAFRKFKCRSQQHVGDETIDFRGFKKALGSLGIRLSEQKMRHVFNKIDSDGSRLLDFNEFESALRGEKVTTSNVTDWKTEVAKMRWKQQEAYNAAARLVRSPTGLYKLLRKMVRCATYDVLCY